MVKLGLKTGMVERYVQPWPWPSDAGGLEAGTNY